MSTEVTELKFEIVPAELGLTPEAKHSLELSFSDYFARAAKWKDTVATITSPKLARAARLEMKSLRVAAEKKRVELKAYHVLMGKGIDGANNLLLSILVPMESQCEEIEKAEERRVAAEIAALDASRKELLAPYQLQAVGALNYGTMPEVDFAALLADAKALHEARIERERKAEADRLAKEVEEAKERERVRLDNERLLKEAAEREEAARIEREKAAAEKKALEAKLAEERAAADAKAKAAAEKAKREREQQEAEANKRLADAEAKALKEKQEADAKAKAERYALEKKAAEERAAREKLEADAKAKREDEERKKRETEEAAEAAALAPDKEKLLAVAATIRAISLPAVKAKKATEALSQFKTKIANLADWIEERAQGL